MEDLVNQSSEYVFVGNELWRIGLLTFIILVSFLLGKTLKYVLSKSSSKLNKSGRNILSVAALAASKSVTFLLFALGLRVGIFFLEIPEAFSGLVFTSVEVLIVLSIGLLVYRQIDVLDIWLNNFVDDDPDTIDDMLMPLAGKSLRVVVVILVLLQIAQTLSDQPITSILTGIGIGGLALGLAAQDTIKNFFGSILIFADKPFNVGELITLDGKTGVVEEVGVRTTKVRTLDGHLLTAPNGNLANSTIHNITRRPYIRRVFSVTITYDTPPEKVQRAIDILKEILDNHEGMDENYPPRVIFDEMASHSLNIKCFYWYHPPDYWKYMEFTETVNMKILKRFNDEGIEFAFPTQTIHLAGDDNRPLNVGIRNKGDDLSTP